MVFRPRFIKKAEFPEKIKKKLAKKWNIKYNLK